MSNGTTPVTAVRDTVNSFWGTIVGAASGFAVGSVVPGVGNVIGAVIGGLAGFAVRDTAHYSLRSEVEDLKRHRK